MISTHYQFVPSVWRKPDDTNYAESSLFRLIAFIWGKFCDAIATKLSSTPKDLRDDRYLSLQYKLDNIHCTLLYELARHKEVGGCLFQHYQAKFQLLEVKPELIVKDIKHDLATLSIRPPDELGDHMIGNRVAIPVTVKNLVGEDHVVLFVIDHQSKQIDYFDSQGLSVMDRGSSLVVGESEMTLAHVANYIRSQCKGYRIRENLTKFQHDSVNCGIIIGKITEIYSNFIATQPWEEVQRELSHFNPDDYRDALIRELSLPEISSH
jgi:hypothetical protein